MADYKDLIPKVQYDIVGAPVPVVVQAIKDGFIQFCERTLVYYEDVFIDTVVDQVEYTLDVSTGYTLIRPIYVKGSDYYLTPVFEGDVSIDEEGRTGTPTSYYMTPDKKLRFTIKPKDVEQFTVRCAIKPSRITVSDTIPDYIYEDNEEALVAAAKMILFSMRNKDWSSQKSAQTQETIFRKKVSELRARMWRSFTNTNKRTKPRPFMEVTNGPY